MHDGNVLAACYFHHSPLPTRHSIFCLGEGSGEGWEQVKKREDLKVWETEFVGRKEGEWYSKEG